MELLLRGTSPEGHLCASSSRLSIRDTVGQQARPLRRTPSFSLRQEVRRAEHLSRHSFFCIALYIIIILKDRLHHTTKRSWPRPARSGGPGLLEEGALDEGPRHRSLRGDPISTCEDTPESKRRNSKFGV